MVFPILGENSVRRMCIIGEAVGIYKKRGKDGFYVEKCEK